MNLDRKVVLVVIDSLGCGAMPDANEYGDLPACNTLCSIANAINGLNLPNFQAAGLGNILPVKGVEPSSEPTFSYGIMQPKSKGKDTTTGHWEIAGLVLDEPFKTYREFPKVLIDEFVEKTNCGGVLGNCPASGTKIIEDLNPEHQKTKYPIVYTSADSVFQIAVDIDLIPVETLYEWCKIARRILDNGWGISRVIARPYRVIEGKPTRIGAKRHDYSVKPPLPTVLNEVEANGGKVYGVGKINDIFVGSGVTQSITTGSNKEGLEKTLSAIQNSDASLIFTNLVDTDMLFGHRRDVEGYKNALVEIDNYLPKILSELTENHMLIITADHGCDPTHPGTDHTREQVPVLIYARAQTSKNLGTKKSFTFVADVVRDWLEI